jgi:F-type H+-transporting ATPase subunit epsilon
MNSKIYAEIFTPDKLVLKDDIDVIHLPTARGNLTIYPNYVDLMTLIVPGMMRIQIEDDEYVYFISRGIAKIEGGKIKVMGEAIERKEDIDIERARRAKERAEKKLSAKDEGTDIQRAQAALIRAMERIKIVEKN